MIQNIFVVCLNNLSFVFLSSSLSPDLCKSKLLELDQGHLLEGLNAAQTEKLLAQVNVGDKWLLTAADWATHTSDIL